MAVAVAVVDSIGPDAGGSALDQRGACLQFTTLGGSITEG